jgi:hypothetical protein
MHNQILEFFGLSTKSDENINWNKTVTDQMCPFSSSRCFKVRKSQDHLLNYMSGEFNFEHLNNPALIGDSMHLHSYKLDHNKNSFRLNLKSRLSTDANGIATCLGLQAEAKIELEQIFAELEKKINDNTLLKIL